MKRIILFMLMLAGLQVSAQNKPQAIKPYSKDEAKDARKNADDFMKSQNVVEALKILDRLVVTDPNDASYNYKLGMCYLNSNINKGKAVQYLEFASNANTKDKQKDIIFDLARAYFYASMYDKALETYERYRNERKGSPDPKLKFDQWVQWASNAKEMISKPVSCQFENLGKNINSPTADIKPVMGAADSVIYFTSKRKGNTGGVADEMGEFPSDVYCFTQNDSGRTKAKNLGVNINTPFYDELCSVNMYGDKMIIYKESPEINNDLYISVLNGKQWDKPVSLGKTFVTKYSETGGCISPDGTTLYFAAEMPGSKTGKDIYRCMKSESTTWGQPERLDDHINTPGDEDFPVIWIDGKTLFFSSTGHNSIGGYDIFKAVFKSPSEGFSNAENIGYPLNTMYDDLGIALTSDGKTAYLAAVRDSGLGDFDLYKVKLDKPLVEKPIVVVDGRTVSASGAVVKEAFVVITDPATGETIANTISNAATGQFSVALPDGKYNVVSRQAKTGKAETELVVDSSKGYKTKLNITFK